MQTGSYKPYSINRFSIFQAAYSGVLLTNAIQGAIPAGDLLATITDRPGNILAGISNVAGTYIVPNIWQYDAPAAMWTLTPKGGLAGFVTLQIVNHADHTQLLYADQFEFLPPDIPAAYFKPYNTNVFTLSGGLNPDGGAYTTANTVGKFTVMDRETAALLVDHAAATPVAGTWQYAATPPTVFTPFAAFRVLGQYYALDGVTLLSTEVTDYFPSRT